MLGTLGRLALGAAAFALAALAWAADGDPIPVPKLTAHVVDLTGTLTADERARIEVDQWLFWQMGGVGPMAGQVHHFKNYAVETLTYAINRYVDEVNRLYGVMNLRLKDRPFIAGKYSIADMAIVGWANGWERHGQDINEFPHFKRWLETMKARPAVKRGMTLGLELRQGIDMKDPKVQAVLFGQRARSA